MTAWLLDVNVLVARLWPDHPFHAKVRLWLDTNEREGWATCAITQLGVVRTLSNPAFDKRAPRPAETLHWLQKSLKENPYHQFWTDELTAFEGCQIAVARLQGFRQTTDAYLLGLTTHNKATFVTLDKRILDLAPPDSEARKSLLILP